MICRPGDLLVRFCGFCEFCGSSAGAVTARTYSYCSRVRWARHPDDGGVDGAKRQTGRFFYVLRILQWADKRVRPTCGVDTPVCSSPSFPNSRQRGEDTASTSQHRQGRQDACPENLVLSPVSVFSANSAGTPIPLILCFPSFPFRVVGVVRG